MYDCKCEARKQSKTVCSAHILLRELTEVKVWVNGLLCKTHAHVLCDHHRCGCELAHTFWPGPRATLLLSNLYGMLMHAALACMACHLMIAVVEMAPISLVFCMLAFFAFCAWLWSLQLCLALSAHPLSVSMRGWSCEFHFFLLHLYCVGSGVFLLFQVLGV